MTIRNDPITELRDQPSLRLGTLYRIRRRDGVVQRFTSVNEPVQFEGEWFLPTSGVLAGDKRLEGGLGKGTTRVVGAVDDDTITELDLRVGRYRNAKIEEYIVDWRYPGAGYFAFNRYNIAALGYEAGIWEAETGSLVTQLEQRIGKIHRKRCTLELGDGLTCRADIVPRSIYYNTVTAVNGATLTIDGTPGSFQNKYAYISTTFNSSSGVPADWFAYGVCEFLEGEGKLERYTINTWTDPIPGGGAFTDTFSVTLIQDPPFTVQVGDHINLIVGCNRLFGTCQSKFSNTVNFGGYPQMPTGENLLQNPAFS